MTVRAIPKEYQKEDVLEIESFDGRALLGNEMGLGKTLTCLWYRTRNPHVGPTVIVCPAHLKYQWEREAATHTNLRFDVAEGQTPPHHPHHRKDGIIINYDILGHWMPYIEKHVKPQSVFLDEIHFVKEKDRKRSKAAKHLGKTVPHIIGCSGTPLLQRPAELWHPLNIIRPDLFPTFWTFGHEYCQPRLGRWGWEFNGATNLGKLHKYLTTHLMVRRLKKDVLKELPPKIRTVVPVKIEDMTEYFKAKFDFLNWLKRQDPAAAARAKNAQELAKVGYLLRLAAKLKCRAVVEWINDYLDEIDGKVILFAKHQEMIRVLEKKVNAKSVTIDGNVSRRERQARVDQFNDDPSTRVFIGSEAAITGYNLTAASTVIFTELWWRPGDHTQAEDRIHRIGPVSTSWIYYLVATNTIEERLCELIQTKQTVMSSVLDGGSLEGDLSIFNQLLAELGRAA